MHKKFHNSDHANTLYYLIFINEQIKRRNIHDCKNKIHCLLDSVISFVDVIRTKGEKLYAYAYKKPSAIQLLTLRAQSRKTETEINRNKID